MQISFMAKNKNNIFTFYCFNTFSEEVDAFSLFCDVEKTISGFTYIQEKFHQSVCRQLPIELNDPVLLEDVQAAHLLQTWLVGRNIDRDFFNAQLEAKD